MNRFTERAQKAILIAQEEAKRLNHDYVGTEHILLGLIALGEGISAQVLINLGVDMNRVRIEIEKIVGTGDNVMLLGEIPFSPRAKKVLEYGIEEASLMGTYYVGTEHLLLGLLREREGVAARVLENLGVNLEDVREEIVEILISHSKKTNIQNMFYQQKVFNHLRQQKTKTPILDEFSRDLTLLAKENKLDPVIAREQEIERIIQILSRRTKNNPVLIGEPGVGKTAIVEGLAQKIVKNDIPDILCDKRVVMLDLSSIVAGTKFRGEFEQRLKNIVDEIRRSKNNIILFIDELHTVIGAGSAEGTLDAANILKPSLARGELQCIGATTLSEYRKYIEKDAPLERRFQPVFVEQPTVEQTTQILKGLKTKYENHHKVKYDDEALSYASELSERFISDRYLPDKAIDLIDEAGSMARLKITYFPDDIKQKELELEKLIKEKEIIISRQEFEKAVKIRDKEHELKKIIENMKRKWREKRNLIIPVVTKEDIAMVVSKWTKIQVTKLTETESEKLISLEKELHNRIIGQDQAIHVISQAIRRSRTGLKDPKKPIGSFIFLGPTGVGKTELARALAASLFGDETALIRFDMSEYMEKFSVSKLIGAPPGYVGYEEGGQFTEKIRRRPYSVILFDEIEKAHSEIFNILLQIFDDGCLTDNFGHKVNFKNTIIILTSNIGARLISNGKALGFSVQDEPKFEYQRIKEIITEEVKKTFNPEFLNRIDEIVIFHPLTIQHAQQILTLMFSKINDNLSKQGLILEFSQQAKEFLLKKGFDETYGARPLRKAIQKYVEDNLAEEILLKKIIPGKSSDQPTKIFVEFDPENAKLMFVQKLLPEFISPFKI